MTKFPPDLSVDKVRAEIDAAVWPMRLFAYQIQGIVRLCTEPEVILADQMGLGKTVQAIAALRLLVQSRAVRSALIVMPVGLIHQWRREVLAWAPDLRTSTIVGNYAARQEAWGREAHLYLISYDTLKNEVKSAGTRAWDLVILDEAQRIKNAQTDVAFTVKQLRRTRAWALTGTPLENHVNDLISILDFVRPGAFDPRTYMVGLRRILREVQLRRRRAEVLHDLPPKLSTELMLDLTTQQQASYRRAEEEGIVRLRALGREVRVSHVLELILRLKQICNFCPETGASRKLEDIRARLATLKNSGEKALVFSQFVAPPFGIDQIAGMLPGLTVERLAGDQGADERAEVVRRFQASGGPDVLLLSLKAGGVGLNLTAASYVFHFDRWWNPATEAQAEDRVHRIGQQRGVHVYSYLTVDTVEERIAQILSEKRTLFADVIDGASPEVLRRLDIRDLLRAIRPGLESRFV